MSPKFRTRHGRYAVCPMNALTFAAVASKTGRSSAGSLLASFTPRCAPPLDVSCTCEAGARKRDRERESARSFLHRAAGRHEGREDTRGEEANKFLTRSRIYTYIPKRDDKYDLKRARPFSSRVCDLITPGIVDSARHSAVRHGACSIFRETCMRILDRGNQRSPTSPARAQLRICYERLSAGCTTYKIPGSKCIITGK